MRKVKGFDGKDHLFNFAKNKSRKDRDNKSKYHIEARSLIREVFPMHSIYEEVTLPGSKKYGNTSLLYADFFIPDLDLIVEVHGEQHYSYSSFFHKSTIDFVMSQKRDRDKIEWCRINNFDIKILPYNERKEWKTILSNS